MTAIHMYTSRLHAKVVTVIFTLKNTGSVAGHEVRSIVLFPCQSLANVASSQVPQLYVSFPASTNSPPSILKGFDSVFLAAGQSTKVTFQLSRYDLSIWNVVTQRWEVPKGTIGINVGASSRKLSLKTTISV